MDDSRDLHATAVAVEGAGILILGASGAGKSDLALQLMALGAGLVADDRVRLRQRDGALVASAPPGLPALIEARGVGLLHARRVGPVALALAVDLDRDEPERLPPLRHFTALGCRIPLLWRPPGIDFASAIFQVARSGRSLP